MWDSGEGRQLCFYPNLRRKSVQAFTRMGSSPAGGVLLGALCLVEVLGLESGCAPTSCLCAPVEGAGVMGSPRWSLAFGEQIGTWRLSAFLSLPDRLRFAVLCLMLLTWLRKSLSICLSLAEFGSSIGMLYFVFQLLLCIFDDCRCLSFINMVHHNNLFSNIRPSFPVVSPSCLCFGCIHILLCWDFRRDFCSVPLTDVGFWCQDKTGFMS